MLQQIDFLFDDKVKDEIQQAPSAEEQMLLKLNVIRKVLNFRNAKDVNDFLIKIHLNCFSFEENQFNQEQIVGSIYKYLKEIKSKDSIPKQSVNGSFTEHQLDASSQEKSFWQQMGNVLDEETIHVWHGLDKFSTKYFDLLQKRKSVLEQSEDLRQQNQELKKLLTQY